MKRDVLAGGKGVTVTEDRNLAHSTISHAIDTDGFVLLEEFMAGEEASMLVLMDESDMFVFQQVKITNVLVKVILVQIQGGWELMRLLLL